MQHRFSIDVQLARTASLTISGLYVGVLPLLWHLWLGNRVRHWLSNTVGNVLLV